MIGAVSTAGYRTRKFNRSWDRRPDGACDVAGRNSKAVREEAVIKSNVYVPQGKDEKEKTSSISEVKG